MFVARCFFFTHTQMYLLPSYTPHTHTKNYESISHFSANNWRTTTRICKKKKEHDYFFVCSVRSKTICYFVWYLLYPTRLVFYSVIFLFVALVFFIDVLPFQAHHNSFTICHTVRQLFFFRKARDRIHYIGIWKINEFT